MKKFFKFMIVGLMYGGTPEIVNQILVKQSVSAFWATMRSYFIFLIILFLLRKLWNKIIKSKRASALSWYIVWGIFGLMIEWMFLGTGGAAWYGQLAMFTFWGTLAFMPVIFSEGLLDAVLRKRIIRYSIVWTVLYIAAGIVVNGGLGLLLWILGSLWLNRYYISYIGNLRSSSQMSSDQIRTL